MNDSQPDSQARKSPLILRFLHGVYAFCRGYFAFVGLLVTFLMGLILYLVGSAGNVRQPMTKDPQALNGGKPSVLTLALDGELLEKSPDFQSQLWSMVFSRREGIYLPDLRATLRHAAKNSRITGLHIDLTGLSGSDAQVAELRRILIDFRAAQKPVFLFAPGLGLHEIFLASAADHLTMAPGGEVFLPGPLFQLMYFGEALRKLGLEMEVIRHGKYKSAFEPLVQNKPSAETLEMYHSTEKALRDYFVTTIAEGRKKSEQDVRQWFKTSIFTPAEALERGLVNQLGYIGEGRAELEKAAHSEGEVSYEDYAEAAHGHDNEDVESGGTGIALIEAVGEIHMEPSGGRGENEITPEALIEELDWAREEKDAKAVVLRISSPGGSAVASDLIWDAVERLAAEKPVVVSMGAVAASGGYYIAAPAKKIFAEPTTVTGSIGVIGMMPKCRGCSAKYGVDFYVVTETERASLFNLGEPSTEADKQFVGKSIDEFYKLFIAKVAEGRGKTPEQIDQLGQGRIYSGVEAKANGLVDELGGLRDAFTEAKTLGGLDVNKLYPILRFEGSELSLSDCLKSPKKMVECLRSKEVSAGVEALLAKDLSPQDRTLAHLSRLVMSFQREPMQAIWLNYDFTASRR